MLKISVVNILLFWFVKYVVFYVFIMFKNSNYALLKVNEIKTGEDLFYYLWLFLILPIVSMIVFTAPTYYLFKVKGMGFFLLITTLVLVVEYFAYTWLASQANLMNGIYNGIITVFIFLLFFYKPIKLVFEQGQ